jgi:hypothetical protein
VSEDVAPEEANARRDRVLSVTCPQCQAGPGKPCGTGNGASHAARWGAWYEQQDAEQPAT